MAQIGTITKYGIPVFEAGDVQEPALDVDVNGQRGRVNLVPYPQRDIPAICCEADGERYGSSTSVHKIIDNWEDGDNNEYYIPRSSGHDSTPTWASLVSGSDRGLLLDGDRRLFSMPGSGLPYYPQAGDAFEFYIRPIEFRDEPAFFRMNFGLQACNTENLYRIEWESDPTPGADLSLEKRKNGTNVIIRAEGDETGVELNTTYRIVCDWRSGGGSSISMHAERLNGSLVSGPLSFNDTEWSSGGVGWETNGYMAMYFDRCRTLPQ